MRRFISIILITLIISMYPIQAAADEGIGIFADPEKTAPDSSGVSGENPFTEESDIFQDSSQTESSKGMSSIYSDLYLKGMEDAVIVAKENKNSAFFCAGFCLGVWGIIIPYIISYDPDISFYKSKKPDYIMGFNEKYNSTLKSENGKLAIYGVVAYYGIFALFYIVMISGMFF